MRSDNKTSVLAPLAPVDTATLSSLDVARGFEVYEDGGPGRIAAMLAAAAEDPTARVAVSLGPESQIVGFAIARSPDHSSRLYTAVPAVELENFEVARPERRRGVFKSMFYALFRRDLEERVVFALADPVLSLRSETTRSFRDRIEAVLGSVGFAPLPTDEPELHPHRDSTLFVRIGRGVPLSDVEDFYARLRAPVGASVAISLRAPVLRNLVRTDLERNGFQIRSVTARGFAEEADVVVTDDGGSGRELTVRLDGVAEPAWRDGTLWYPATRLDRLATDLRRELNRRRASRG